MTQRELQVGDRVRVAKDCWGCKEGAEGEVLEVDGSGMPYRAQIKGKGEVWFRPDQLKLIAPSPLSITLPGDPPASISINGVTYVAQAEAAAEEEGVEVKQGQVWTNPRSGNYILILDGDKTTRLDGLLLGLRHKDMHERKFKIIAPSLREALTSGKLKPEDL